MAQNIEQKVKEAGGQNQVLKDKHVLDSDVSVARIKIHRKNGDTVLNLWCCEQIEKIFKSDNIERSTVYRSNGDRLSYYKLRGSNLDADMLNLEKTFKVGLRDYGGGLYRPNNTPNFSLVRTVGVSRDGGIDLVVDNLVSMDTLKRFVSGFRVFLKSFYREFVSDILVESSIYVREV